MADDQSLLLKIKGDSASAKAALAETRAAIASLRATSVTEFGAMQNVGSKAFATISDSLNVFVGQRIPLVGGAFVRVTENLKNFGAESTRTASEVAKFDKVVEGLATKAGKTGSEMRTFLTSFVQLETQAKRDSAAIEFLGAATAQKLIPELEKAGTGLSQLAVSGEEAAGGLAGVLASMGPVGIAVAGIAVEAVAGVVAIGILAKTAEGLVESFLDMAKSAAGFRGELFDMSQQTGVSVETLNALGIVADETGGNIQSITQSLVIFQGKLDEAQNESSKAGQKFKELGISTHDTETAFRSALVALAKMPEGFHQTNEAAELFGRRGGKQVLAILKETNGDIDSVVSRLGNLAKVTTEDSQEADEFNDRLRDLQIQFRGLVGKEAIPAATAALVDLSKLLKENQILIDVIGGAVKILGLAFQGWAKAITDGLNVIAPALEATAELWERIAAAMERARDIVGVPRLVAGIPAVSLATIGVSGRQQSGPENVGGGEAGFSVTDAHQDASNRGFREARKKAAGVSKEQRELEQRLETQVAFWKDLISQSSELSDALAGVDTKTKEYAVTQAIANGALKDAKQGYQELVLATAKTIDSLTKRIEVSKAAIEFTKKQDEAVELLIHGEKGFIEQAVDVIQSLIKTGDRLTITQEHWLLFKASILATNESLKLTKETLESMPAALAGVEGLPGLGEKDIANAAGAAANKELGPPPVPPKVIDSWGILRATAMDAIGQIAQGIGQLAQQWVLYGNLGPNAMRKMVASVLAGVAAQAAVLAVMELAYGIAALTPWGAAIYGPAPFHFKSAALFGGIALVSAAAGRLAAGSSFSQPAGGGGGGGGGGGSSSAPPPIKPVEVDRQQGLRFGGSQPSIVIHLSGEAAEAFNFKVVKAVVGNHRLNGEIRQITERGES